VVVHRSSSVFRPSVRRSPPSLAVRRCPAHWRKSLFSLLIRALAGPGPGLAWRPPPAPGPGDPPRGPRRQLPARPGPVAQSSRRRPADRLGGQRPVRPLSRCPRLPGLI
jgi:hypothetical protein